MEFDKFLEKSIIAFLDEQAGKVADKVAALREEEFDLFEITKDYSRDIDEALKASDLKRAQRTFEDIKNKYAQAQPNSSHKRRLYVILEEIYEKIKDYEEREEGKKNLFETIREYEQQGLFSRPELFEKKQEESIHLVMDNIALKENEIEGILSKEKPSQEDARQAIIAYKEMRRLLMSLPSTSDDKDGIVEKAEAWYKKIALLKKRLVTQGMALKEAREVASEEPIEHKFKEIRQKKAELVMMHQDLERVIARKDLGKSQELYAKLKALCDELPDELSHEKDALLAELLIMASSIAKLKDGTGSNKKHDVEANEANERRQKEKELKEKEQKEREQKQKESEQKRKEEERLSRIRHQLKSEIALLQESLIDLINQKDVPGCIAAYKKLKNLSKEYPSESEEERSALLADVLSSFSAIKKLKEELENRKKAEEEDNLKREEEDEKREIMRKEILGKIGTVKELLSKKEAALAMQEYKRLKMMFKDYPEAPIGEKKKLYDEIMGAHKDILLLEEDLKRKMMMESSQVRIGEIESLLVQANELLEKGRAEEAAHIILEVKHKIQLLPKEEFDDKYRLLSEVEKSEHRFLFAKNMRRMALATAAHQDQPE